MRHDIKLSDGCKPASSKPHCLHGKGSPRRKGGKLLHLPVGDFRTAGTLDLGTMAYGVALATLTVRTSPPGSPLGEAA